MMSRDLARELRALATFVDREVSGQRYGQFGAPYVDTAIMREAADWIDETCELALERR